MWPSIKLSPWLKLAIGVGAAVWGAAELIAGVGDVLVDAALVVLGLMHTTQAVADLHRTR